MHRILSIENTRGNAVHIVNAAVPDHLLEAGIVEGIEVFTRVTELIDVKDDIGILLKSLHDAFNKIWSNHRVRISYHDDLSVGDGNSCVVHEMLVVTAVFGHFEEQPAVDLILDFLQGLELARKIFDEDDLEIIPRHSLLVQIMQQMKALAHTPIEEHETDPRCLALTGLNEAHVAAS